MSFNKKILALAIAGALPGAAFATVDLNVPANGITPVFANEVTIPLPAGLNINNAPDELDVRVSAGFGVSALAIRFIRFDFPGAKLKTALVGGTTCLGDFTLTDQLNVPICGAGVSPAFTVVSGGNVDDSFVIVQVTAGGPAGILPTDRFVFHPALTNGFPLSGNNAVAAFDKNPQTIKYALYEFGGNAVSQTSPLSGPLSGNWYTWSTGLNFVCEAPTGFPNLQIDASDPRHFVGPSPMSGLFNLTLGTAPGVLLPSTGSVPGGLSDFMGVGTTLKATGSLVGLTLTPPTLLFAGGDFDVDGSFSFGTWGTTPSGLPVAFGPTTVLANLTTALPGSAILAASTYSLLLTPTPGLAATLSPITKDNCGRLEYSGSSDRVDFGLTPGAGNKQFLRITNPTKDTGKVNVTVWNDSGTPPNNTVTFPLSAVKVGAAPGVNLPGTLGAFASTPMIDVNAFDAAAKSVNAAFSVGTGIDGKPGKIRIEVRGDFGDNLVDGNGNETAPVLKKGIYIQAINNGTYHQSH